MTSRKQGKGQSHFLHIICLLHTRYDTREMTFSPNRAMKHTILLSRGGLVLRACPSSVTEWRWCFCTGESITDTESHREVTTALYWLGRLSQTFWEKSQLHWDKEWEECNAVSQTISGIYHAFSAFDGRGIAPSFPRMQVERREV